MSGNVKDPSLGMSGEPIVRKRGRPKKVRMKDDEGGARKRQKLDSGAGAETGLLESKALSIGSQVRDTLLDDGSKKRENASNCAQQDRGQSEMPHAVMDVPNASPGSGEEAIGPSKEEDGSEEAMKESAWEVVLQVHGTCIPAIGGAAVFPGETGRGGGDSSLCSCCKQPEIKRQTIVCDDCEQSFHIRCMKLSPESANGLDDWLCPSCSVKLGLIGDSRGSFNLGRQYLERKLGRSALLKLPQTGLTGNGHTVRHEHERNLDLNEPADSILDEFDQTQSQSGPAEEKLRQEPWRLHPLKTTSNFQELQKEGQAKKAKDNSAPTQMEAHAGNICNDRSVSDFQKLPRDAVMWSPNSLAKLAERRNGKLPERAAEFLVGQSLESDSGGADGTVSKLSAAREEFGNVTEDKPEKSPEKLAIISKELGKAMERQAFYNAHEPAEARSSKRIGSPEELPSVSGSNLSNTLEMPVRLIEHKLFDPILSASKDSSLLNSSPKVILKTSNDTSENLKPAQPSESDLPGIIEKYDSITPSMVVDPGQKITAGTVADTSEVSTNLSELEKFDITSKSAKVGESKLFDPLLKTSLSRFSARVEASLDGDTSRRVGPSSEFRQLDSTSKSPKVGESKVFDLSLKTSLSKFPERVEASLQGDANWQVRPSSEVRQLDIASKSAKVGAGKVLDPSLRTSLSRFPERVEVSLQGDPSRQVRPSLPVASPVTYIDLTGDAYSDGEKPKNVNHVDFSGPVHDKVHGQTSNTISAETSQVSSEEQQLKKVGEDTLQQLKDFINEKHGLFLGDGWEVEVRKRKNERHLDKYYISPEKQRFRSRLEVMRHLGLSDSSKGKSESQQSQPRDWSSMVQKLAKGKDEMRLPFKCGELMIESLGVVDVRPGFRDELQIWPVGYRSTWHDSTTASLCISEVVDNGTSTPTFRVTRKFCPTFVALSNEDAGVTIPSYGKGYVGVSENGSDNWATSEVKTASFLSQPLFSGLSRVTDREDRESLKALLGDLGDSIDEQENMDAWECTQARDAIGEFTVEAGSTRLAWRLFAEEFIERCRRTPWVVDLLPDICPHFKFESRPNLLGLSETPGLSSDQSPDPGYPRLLEKLAEDRFGLSETLVKGMIEALPNADNCMGYKSLEDRGLCWKADDSVVSAVSQPRFRAREKARRHRKAPEVQNEEQSEPVEPTGKIDKDEIVAIPPRSERPPPPAGQPLGQRLPPEVVGDVLQIWEFLSRFSEVIGLVHPPLLEELEEGLICGAAIVSDSIYGSSSLSANCVESGGNNIKLDSETVPILVSDVLTTIMGSSYGDVGGSPHPVTKAPASSHHSGPTLSQGSRQAVKDGLQEIRQQDFLKSNTGSPRIPASLADVMKPDTLKGEDCNVDSDKSPTAKFVISSGFATAGSIHMPLINYLLSDLQSKVCGPDEVPGETEETKPLKRGRKRVRDTVLRPVLGREKLSESFSMNEWTWPEIARRYLISVSRFSNIGEIAEDNTEECMKVLRCIQGDGGILCGALDGVAGMEVDAQLLAEAEKELLTGSRESEDTPAPNTPPQMGAGIIVEGGKGNDGTGETARWVKILDPIAKLPTNVGSRIRNRVRDALEAGPPDWAVELLEKSISKEVYKGNASGPTKRAVMDVLAKYRGEDPKVRKSKKLRKRVLPSPEVVMQRCRIVLRQVAAADTGRIVSTGIGSIITNFYESGGESLLPRPLDFRAIDLRLGAGAYGTSPAAFAADVRQIWRNVSSVYGSDSDEFEETTALSELFESLYSKQVIIFQGGVDNTSGTSADGKSMDNSGEVTAPNAAGEQRSGHDAGETVKAPWEDDSCRICGIDDDHDNVLLCDACDAEYHIYCLNPPLTEVPEGNWYCSSCVAVDKGFLEVPSVTDAVTEIKVLDKQDEQLHLKGVGTEDGPEKEQLRSGYSSEHMPLRTLAVKLSETDYWHLNLAERVCLLKCLCDQALDTLKLRIHMEEVMDLAMELQQKLRNLLAERRRYAELAEARLENSKEAANVVLQAGGVKIKRQHQDVGNETGANVEPLQRQTVEVSRGLETDQKQTLGSDQHIDWAGLGLEGSRVSIVKESTVSSGVQLESSLSIQKENDVSKELLKDDAMIDAMEIDFSSEQECRNGLEGREEKPGLVLGNLMRPIDTSILNECEGSKDIAGSFTKEETNGDLIVLINGPGLETEVGKVSLQHPMSSSPLDPEIGKVITKLLTVNMRRDLLGKDDHGREYWALFGSKSTPWLAVEVVDADDRSERDDGIVVTGTAGGRMSSTAPSVLHSFENWDNDEVGRRASHISQNESTAGPAHVISDRGGVDGEGMQRKQQSEHRWYAYSDEDALDQVIDWLLPTSAQEKALKSTLLQWRPSLLIHKRKDGEKLGSLNVLKQDAGAPTVDTISTDLTLLNLPANHTRQTVDVPVLRATRILEWKYGRFGNSTLKETWTPVPPKRGRKKKTQSVAEISRCKCLEPIWASRCHCMSCHTTFESAADLEAHMKGAHCSSGGDNPDEQEMGKKTGKKGVHSGKHGLSSKPPETPSPQQLLGIMTKPPDVSKMPFHVCDSTRNRVNRIGLIADKGPTFAPGLSVAPAFDPSLMIVDSPVEHPLSSSEGASGSSQHLLDALAVGETSRLSHGENSKKAPWVLVRSSEDLPGKLDGASESGRGQIDLQDPLGVSMKGVGPFGSSADAEGLLLSDGTAERKLWKDPDINSNSDNFADGIVGLPMPGRTKAGGRLFQVTGKQLFISEASLHPLKGKDLNLLQQLKIKLLDIEAVLTTDMLEIGRSDLSRRQSWRSLVKFAKSIYMMVQATILLEQMVCADFLKGSWCYWSSFSAAAKTATLSSLFLRVCALDAAIAYENSENYAGMEISVSAPRQGKRERDDKKKGNQLSKVVLKKRRKDDVAT